MGKIMIKQLDFLIALVALSVCACNPKSPTPNGVYDDAVDAVADDRAKRPITGNPVPNDASNLLVNPSFEDGLDKWIWLDWSKGWAPFALSSDHAHSGRYSLHLPLYSADKRQTVVWGGVQEVELPGDIPECIDGYYFVENWETGNWKQYLQLVVIDLTHPLPDRGGQAQLRYIVSGSKEPPLNISNAQYLFVENERRARPVEGKWTYFSVNPKKDFYENWKYIPQSGSKLRLLFEARYDHHRTTIPARGDVYYDDLYFGPKTPGHCE